MVVIKSKFFENKPFKTLDFPSLILCVSVHILALNITETSAENILFYIGALSSHSHRAGLEPLALKLADKGHNVTFFTPLENKSKSKHPNVTDFCIKELIDAHNDFLRDFGVIGLQSRLQSRFNLDLGKGTALFDYGLEMCEVTLKSMEFQDWLQRSPKFDLVVIDKSSMSECAFAIAHKLKTRKIISYVGISFIIAWDMDLYGMPAEISWVPTFQSVYQTKELSFFDRLHSEYTVLHWYFLYTWYYLPKIDKLAREGFQIPDMPPIEDLIRSEAVILSNAHYSDTFAKSLPPFIIPIGGMHLQESNGILPRELENFLSSSEEGFIYVSFGSIVRISTLPPKILQIFFSTFKNFDQQLKFFWKWEGKFPENIPKNVLLRNWFPQQDVLAHPKIKGFVTQGGQVSIQQAIFHAVPLIILPVNGDQDYNAKRIRNAGNGIELEFFDLTEENLRDAIHRLLNDKSYNQIASKLSNASKDRPLHPVDLAVWWTEFVLRQDDVSYLKPGSMNVSWWVTRSLDIYAFVFLLLSLCLVLILLAIFYTMRILKRLFFNRETPKPSKKKKI